MLYGSRLALACSGIWRVGLIFLVIAHPIPLDGPTLEKIEARGAKGPKDSVDEVGPPGDAEPFLVDKEKAAIEEEQGEFDEDESDTLHDHGYPNKLESLVSFIRVLTASGGTGWDRP